MRWSCFLLKSCSLFLSEEPKTRSSSIFFLIFELVWFQYSVLPWYGSRLVQVPTSTRISFPSSEVCSKSLVPSFSLLHLAGDYLYFFVIVQLFWFYDCMAQVWANCTSRYQMSRSPDCVCLPPSFDSSALAF